MNFRRQSNTTHQTRKSRVRIVFIVLVVAVVLFDRATGGGVVAYFVQPTILFSNVRIGIDRSLGSLRTLITSKQKLAQEKRTLTDEIVKYQLYALNNKLLSEENAQLRNILSTTAASSTDAWLPETVQSRIGTFPYGTFVISRTHKNMGVGAYVFAKNNVALGTISKISTNASIVSLFTAPARKVSAVIVTGDTQVPVTLTGYGLGNFRGRVPRSISIQKGDVVRLDALPQGIIGVVGALSSRSADAFQIVHIIVPIPLNTIDTVVVRVL